eukprot:jgi/Ulvmu1/4213/UM019_0192.1
MAILRLFDSLCKFYLIAHVVIGLLFDSQTVLPHSWYPQELLDVVDGYATLGDDLVRGAPAWFRSLVWMEILIQMPLSVFLIWTYQCKVPSLRWAALLYSTHVITTMPPIIAHFSSTLEAPHIWCVLSIYSPWVVFPTLMLLRFSFFPKAGIQPAAQFRSSTIKRQ